MNKVKFLVAAILSVLFVACSEEENLSQTSKTGFQISLTESVKVDSRSTPAELGKPLISQFNLKITNQVTGRESYNGSYKDFISAAAGMYTIEAECGDDLELALDNPYYKGSVENVTLENGESKSVKVICTVANALASVVFDNNGIDSFDEQFSSYGIKVKVGASSTTIGNNGKSAYYRAGSKPTFTFVGTLKNGTPIEEVPLEDAKLSESETFGAGQHCVITLKLREANSGAHVEISKVEVDKVTINETIPMEWLPKPKIAGFNNDGATIVTQVETADAVPAVLNFTGSMNIQDVELTLDLKDVDYVSLNRTYTLSVLSEEDRTALTNAGLVLPILNEAKEGNIDFTTLVGKLKIASGSETTHNIKLRVKANDRWSSEENSPAVYEIKTIAPKISITVKPEDIWSKSLTVSGVIVESGNEAMINSNLKYQFNDNGTWKNCNENNLAMLTEHPSDCKMQVRAVYRGVVECEPTTFALEVPEQLPNGNMDGWSYEIYGDRYSFNPWTDGGTPFWDTSNDFTTRHRNNVLSSFIDNYNGFHSVSYVAGKNAIGLAAELRSTANGRGNTRASIGNWVVGHTEQDYNKVAGELFTGKTNVTTGINDADGGGDTYEKEKNASFSSRPTALQFYYKYLPYGSDTWSVHIELLDENKNIIIQNEKTSSETMSDWSAEPYIVELNYADDMTYAKCKYIYVIFKSTINEGANMPYQEITQTFYVLENGILNAKTYSPAYVGSVLTIDDISLVYDK